MMAYQSSQTLLASLGWPLMSNDRVYTRKRTAVAVVSATHDGIHVPVSNDGFWLVLAARAFLP